MVQEHQKTRFSLEWALKACAATLKDTMKVESTIVVHVYYEVLVRKM